MGKYVFLEGEGGSTGDVVDAHDVGYQTTSDPSIQNVWEALDKLLYVGPSGTMTGGGTYELGSVVHGVHLTWSFNKAIVSQSLDHGVGTLPVDQRSYDFPDDISVSTSFSLTASDGKSGFTISTSVSFQRKAYWGPSPKPTLTNADILALSQAFATSKSKSVSYDCTGKQYPYFCYPVSFGALTDVRVGGLAFSDFSQSIVSLTNASGHTEDYYVTRFNGIQSGANIQVVWA